jgi:hypothetical protein
LDSISSIAPIAAADALSTFPILTREDEFWIGLGLAMASVLIGIATLCLAWRASREAANASAAARRAEQAVLNRITAGELIELNHELIAQSAPITLAKAIAVLQVVQAKLRRLLTPIEHRFPNHPRIAPVIQAIYDALTSGNETLNNLAARAANLDAAIVEGFNVYVSIQPAFSEISSGLSALTGLVEDGILDPKE